MKKSSTLKFTFTRRLGTMGKKKTLNYRRKKWGLFLSVQNKQSKKYPYLPRHLAISNCTSLCPKPLKRNTINPFQKVSCVQFKEMSATLSAEMCTSQFQIPRKCQGISKLKEKSSIINKRNLRLLSLYSFLPQPLYIR